VALPEESLPSSGSGAPMTWISGAPWPGCWGGVMMRLPPRDPGGSVVHRQGPDVPHRAGQQQRPALPGALPAPDKVVSKCRTMVDLSLRLLHHLQRPAAFASYAKQLAATFG